MLKLTFKITIS